MSIQSPWKDLLAEPLTRDHLVQLYKDERALAEAVALFAGSGLGKGEAVIVVATPEHIRVIEMNLASNGFEIDDLKAWGQLAVVDASDTLARFMVDGMPDPALCKRVIGEVIDRARAAGRYRKVRVYGEMVNLLWSDNLPAALRLEEIWNELIPAHSISLFCAYFLDHSRAGGERFPSDLRAAHSHLIPLEASL